MHSMTGYAYREIDDEEYSIALEIKSYNNRYLDVFVYLPSGYSPLENDIRQRVSQEVRRGKVEVSVRVKRQGGERQFAIDSEFAGEVYRELTTLSHKVLKTFEAVTLSNVLAVEGVFLSESTADIEGLKKSLLPGFEACLKEFIASRKKEGEATARDILKQLGIIESALVAIGGQIPAIEKHFVQNLQQRFEELVGIVDRERVLAETAVLLAKTSINEELARLEAHVSDFRHELAHNPAPGKKLDFLCQELNREINTIGSKSPDIEVSRTVIAMKDALENIREQLRNVE